MTVNLLLLLSLLPPALADVTVRPDPAPASDYFHRSSLLVTLDPQPGRPVWLVIEHPDVGYGLISLDAGIAQGRQWGVARLNTGKQRRAWFALEKPPRQLRIYGLSSYTRIELAEAEPPRDPVPLVQPAIAFKNFPQRVITAGADAQTPDGLPEALAAMRNLLPLARALGFNGIESYVKWGFVERSPGALDWSFYDAVCDELDRHGLQWFPLLIAGSAYALPDWYRDSPDNRGFQCLEHRLGNDIQSIFCGTQDRHVERFLKEFGRHYGGRKTLLGIRLGPSGNYGEAQYPATGEWGFKGGPIHTHQGYWAADPCAAPHFRNWLRRLYPSIEALNQAWEARYASWEAVETFHPLHAVTRRQRIDFSDWYMNSMSEWCERWALWARSALPGAPIYQSSGGWGSWQIGTDFSSQARAMAKLGGGIRLTNESDNFADNFSITRMAASAARFYGAALGFEPGGFGSARGVAARLFNALTNGAEHLFFYHPNLYANDQGIDAWLKYAPWLERRARPKIQVAVFYPDTAIKLDDEPLRFRWGSVFLVSARGLRSQLDFDYVSEPMIEDGALSRYRALVFLWGHITEKRIADKLEAWLRGGGTIIYPERPRGALETVEGDRSIFNRWRSGDTGKGRFILFEGDPQPPDHYARFIREQLQILLPGPIQKPDLVFGSLLESGELFFLNFSDDPATVRLPDSASLTLPPYGIAGPSPQARTPGEEGGAKGARLSIIPRPVEVRPLPGRFALGTKTVIIAAKQVAAEADYLSGLLAPALGGKPDVKLGADRKANAILLRIDGTLEPLGPEGYELRVTPEGIDLAASKPAGVFYGLQSLRQLLPPLAEGPGGPPGDSWTISGVEIRDRPRFRWRGLLLDVARHFRDKEFIKRAIDLIALYKLNVLQLHLTDDQGWRVEIKRYPRLTEIGAWRGEGGQRYGGFYTQDEIREIVAHAAARHVTVVPEFEMPGHSLAALASYPELSCAGGPFSVATSWGIFEDVHCAGNDEAFQFLQGVLDEAMDLFPSEFIHIGGDECPKKRWKGCPRCQARIKAEGLKDEHELQSYFVRRLEKHLNSKGRRLIGWDEILEGGLAPHATVMSWRGMEGALAAARAGHDYVAAPTTHCYLDYPHTAISVEKAYSFEPVPEALPTELRRHCLGLQGNLWSEHTPTAEAVDCQVWPRIIALAEAAWSQAQDRDWQDFEPRLEAHYERLRSLGVRYFTAESSGR
ncbi:MAG: family 20 glycosylhydrolase [Planctomycetes bacterium]|nr:family 20 glycosylhydrolase [Planctomycetota bacterium]